MNPYLIAEVMTGISALGLSIALSGKSSGVNETRVNSFGTTTNGST